MKLPVCLYSLPFSCVLSTHHPYPALWSWAFMISLFHVIIIGIIRKLPAKSWEWKVVTRVQ